MSLDHFIAAKHSLMTLTRKYKAKKFGQVTNWPEVRGEMIKRIAKMK